MSFINTIDVVGDEVLIDSILTGTITDIRDDVITELCTYALYRCSYLQYADFPNLRRILWNSLNGTGVKALVLRNQSVIPYMNNSNAIGSTPIASGTGYIYVPRALLSDDDATRDYRRASNWSVYADQFRALEDYTVDGTVSGELDETKI